MVKKHGSRQVLGKKPRTCLFGYPLRQEQDPNIFSEDPALERDILVALDFLHFYLECSTQTFITCKSITFLMNWEIIGYIGAACTTFCFLPQILKAVKTKELDDFSYGYLSVLAFGVLMWLIYGIGIENMVVISANAITLCFVFLIISMKAWYHSKHRH